MAQEKRWWMGYTRNGKEFEVFDQLEALGIDHWRGERIEFRRVGKDRDATAFREPALPNYIFMRPDVSQFWQIRQIKFLSTILEPLGRLSIGGNSAHKGDGSQEGFVSFKPSEVTGLERFMAAADARLAQAERAKGNREAIAEYHAGQAIEVQHGALAGQMGTFLRKVRHAHDAFAKIEAEIDMMGGKVRVELDPLDVRKAG